MKNTKFNIFKCVSIFSSCKSNNAWKKTLRQMTQKELTVFSFIPEGSGSVSENKLWSIAQCMQIKPNKNHYFYIHMFTKLSTERLSLDALTAEDGGFIRELLNTKGWLQFIGDRNIHSKEDAIDYINKINATANFYYWAVRLADTLEPIGVISFLKRHYLEHFDIGFAFLPQYIGKGYAHEAAKEVLSVVSSMPEHSIIMATTMPGNTSSIKLLQKLGLQFEKEVEVGDERLQVYSNAAKV